MCKPNQLLFNKKNEVHKDDIFESLGEEQGKRNVPLIFAPAQLPNMPNASAYNANMGIIGVAARTLATAKKRTGLTEDTSLASICSDTLMKPSSAPIPEPTFPAQINAVKTGSISLIIDRVAFHFCLVHLFYVY